jgi:putative ABC transport system permease protein
MLAILADLRAALLSFRRRPAFAAAIVVTLALGIAPNCVIFAIMDGVYFRPLPYPEQQRLVLLNLSHPSKASIDEVDPFTFGEWQRRATGFESTAAYRSVSFTLNSGDRPERVQGQVVTADFFEALGMQPSLGRAFRAEDAAPGAPGVLVISHRTWQDYFSARADIVGTGVRVNGVPATVVGVMPPAFGSFMEGRAARVWAPMALEAATAPSDARAGNAVGRLKVGVSLEHARAELESAQAALARQFPDFYRDRASSVRDFRSSIFGGLGPGLQMLSVMVGLLLLIACGNAANLLLGRSVQRAREVAVRTALGARRAQLARGLVAESLVLALAAALLGLVMAYWGLQFLWARTGHIFQVIGVDALAFDQRVLAFAVLLTLVTTALFGVLPALRGSRIDLVGTLKEGTPGAGRGTRRSRMSRTLVVGQVALCVVTMIGATIVLRSVVHFSRLSANPGFRPQALLVATLPHSPAVASEAASGLAGGVAGPARLATVEEIDKRVMALPGVDRVAVTDHVPFLEAGVPVKLGKASLGSGAEATKPFDAEVRLADGDFFAVMSMPLLRGRLLTNEDNAGSLPVAVISDRLAAAYWKDAEPIGEQIEIRGTWRTIVGVVGSTVQPTPFHPAARELFVPYRQSTPGDVKIIVQSRQSIASLAPALRRAIRQVDADQPVADLETMEQALGRFMTPFRLILVLTVLFAATALALAAVGLYAVIAHGVSRRTREMGIRMALGAGRAQVVRLVMREGLRLALTGLILGLLPGLALAKILPSGILGVGGLSLAHYSAAMGIWLGVALVACLVPARRAARVDPMSALRCE